MADKEDEREPLLQSDSQALGPPPQYTPHPDDQSGYNQPGYSQAVQSPSGPHPIHVTVPPIGPDELPPPYTPTPQGGPLMINCKVCQNPVSIEGKQNQHVVKCQVCNEATPIKAPPPGKKYVRCPCNCLLICRATAQKIACPRTNCKRILNMASNGMISNVTVRTPGTNRIQCYYCNNTYLFTVVRTPLARCPHCRRVNVLQHCNEKRNQTTGVPRRYSLPGDSPGDGPKFQEFFLLPGDLASLVMVGSSVTPDFVKYRIIIYLILGFVFLGAGIGVTVGTYEMAAGSGGIYTVWIGAFIIGILFLIRGCYFSTVRTSQILGPAA